MFVQYPGDIADIFLVPVIFWATLNHVFLQILKNVVMGLMTKLLVVHELQVCYEL